MNDEHCYSNKSSKTKIIVVIIVVGIFIAVATYFIINFTKSNNAKSQYIQSIKAIFTQNGITDENINMNQVSLDETDKIYNVTINSEEFSKLSADNQLKVELAIQNIKSQNLGLNPYAYINSQGNKYDVFDIARKHYSTPSDDSNASVGDSISENASKEPVADDEKGACWALAEDVVKSKLKSPSTAKFPFSYGSDGVSMTKSGTLYTVSAWVDAENSYGAESRSSFIVIMTKSGYGDNAKFTAESCEID